MRRRSLAPFDRPWSIRAELLGIIGAVAVLLLVAGAAVSIRDMRRAEARALEGAAFHARLAAGEVAAGVNEATDLVRQTAREHDLAAVIAAGPGECALAAGGLGVFRDAYLALARPDGSLVCTSLPERTASSFAGSPWIDHIGRIVTTSVSDPFHDPVSGRWAVAVSAPVRRDGTYLGSFSAVLPLDRLGATIRQRLGGPQGYSFVVTAPHARVALSSAPEPGDAPAPLDGTGFLDPRPRARDGLDGVRRLYAASEVGTTGWLAFAGLDPGAALGPARREVLDRGVIALAALAFALALGALFHRRAVTPLRRLRAAVEQAGRSVQPETLTVQGPAEIAALVREFNGAVETRRRVEEQIAFNQLHDALTGLPNRALLLDRANEALKRTQRNPERLAMLFVNIDRFQMINERLGHDAGDAVIAEVAQRTVDVVRPDDTVARFGGDRFVVLCENLRSRDQAEVIAERIHRAVEVPLTSAGEHLRLSVTIGIAMGRNHGTKAEDLLRDADIAAAHAKARGERHAFFEMPARNRAVARFDMERDLRVAIEGGAVSVHYQPKVDLDSGAVVGMEALLRWRHPRRGTIRPSRFLEIAESSGLIHPLGRLALEDAARRCAEWSGNGKPVRVSINFSARQLASAELPGAIEAAIAREGIDPARIIVEITEGTLLDDTAAVAEALERLERTGVGISVDDFGTGYSSLAYLERFHVDELKIDRRFVSALGAQPAKTAMVGAIVEMARALRIDVVAEGVEEDGQVEALLRLGVHTGQGFYFAPAMPARRAAELLSAGEPFTRPATAS